MLDCVKEKLWSPGRRMLLMTFVLVSMLGAASEVTTIAILPSISSSLGGLAFYGWAAAAFNLGAIAGGPIGGNAADRFGSRLPFLAGCLIFLAGVALVAVAPTMEMVVLARVVCGVGGGLFTGAVLSAQAVAVPAALRARVLAITLTAWLPVSLFVPQFAAYMQDLRDWRWAYSLPFVLGVVVLLVGVSSLPSRGSAERRSAGVVAFAFSIAAAVALLIGGLRSFNTPAGVIAIVVGLGLGAASARALMPPGTLIARKGLPAATLSKVLFGFGVLALEAFETLLIVGVRGESVAVGALAITAGSLAVVAGGWIHERLTQSIAIGRLLQGSSVVMLLGVVAVGAGTNDSVPVFVIFIGVAIRHLGWGIANNGTGEALLALAPKGREGAATSAANTLQSVGFVLGPGIGGIFVAASGDAPHQAASGILVVAAMSALVIVAAGLVSGRISGKRAADIVNTA